MEKYRFVFVFLSQEANSRLCLESRPQSTTAAFLPLGQFELENVSLIQQPNYFVNEHNSDSPRLRNPRLAVLYRSSVG